MVRSLICKFAGHSIDRQRVWHDGRNFRCKCQSCGKPMLRDRNGWREFDLDADVDVTRAPHPVTGEVA
ncbi:MAG: hypothetical protein H6920_08115 [Sphingomonadaceae bacterium]|nr:hypothetical protein [Altererythrobacter sp.]MCP5391566.1 hypothetical protein [Sphingomonadaceae bacterium]MCP5394533.1 hypothetical protein [Sphingomonadaceae bacterium]